LSTGFDSTNVDLDLTYDPSTNTLTSPNLASTSITNTANISSLTMVVNDTLQVVGISNLDSTNVDGDLRIENTGRLLDEFGRSFVVLDSAGAYLWGNDGTDAGAGGPGGGGAGGISFGDLDAVTSTAAGTGTLIYDDAGTFTYTPPDLSVYALTASVPTVLTDLGIPDGTSNQYLQTDGNGVFTFQTIPAGGVVADINDITNVVVTAPTEGQVLKYNTATSTWVNSQDLASGTNGLLSRSTYSSIVTLINSNSYAQTTITNSTELKTYSLLKVQVSHASWVRIYVDTASRTADINRLQSEDPAPGSGVIAEIITTGAETVLVAPAVIGFTSELTPGVVPIAINNLETSAAVNYTVTLTDVGLES
jgi:hypothetical protein